MNRRQKGNALSQYAIIIGLVALAAVPAFLLFGNQIVSALTTYAGQYSDMNNQLDANNKSNTNSIANNNASTVDLNNDQTGNCTNNTCSIDFGDIKLSGVPQDLNKLVETSGVSGGMDNLTSLLDQIAQQYEEQGKTEEAKDIKILATTGHNMAAIQKDFENLVFNTCKGNQECFNSYINKEYKKPAGYDETYQAFPKGVTYYDTSWLTSIGGAIKNINSNYPQYAISKFYNQTLNKIKNNDGISNTAKGVIQELTWDIGTIGEKWNLPFALLTEGDFDVEPYNYIYEPLTGKETRVPVPAGTTYESIYNDIQNINAPELTHIDSGLICASGSYTDTGTACH